MCISDLLHRRTQRHLLDVLKLRYGVERGLHVYMSYTWDNRVLNENLANEMRLRAYLEKRGPLPAGRLANAMNKMIRFWQAWKQRENERLPRGPVPAAVFAQG